jgi:hypothetical protein
LDKPERIDYNQGPDVCITNNTDHWSDHNTPRLASSDPNETEDTSGLISVDSEWDEWTNWGDIYTNCPFENRMDFDEEGCSDKGAGYNHWPDPCDPPAPSDLSDAEAKPDEQPDDQEPDTYTYHAWMQAPPPLWDDVVLLAF